jgi:hypothetical protein
MPSSCKLIVDTEKKRIGSQLVSLPKLRWFWTTDVGQPRDQSNRYSIGQHRPLAAVRSSTARHHLNLVGLLGLVIMPALNHNLTF